MHWAIEFSYKTYVNHRHDVTYTQSENSELAKENKNVTVSLQISAITGQ